MSVQLSVSTSDDAVSAFVGRWRQGERTNARDFVEEYPEWGSQKSVVLHLAYAEYCLRRESGETVLPSTLCEQFPHYRHSLRRYLSVRAYVNRDQEGWQDELLNQLEKWEQEDRRKAAAIRWPEPGEQFLGFEILEDLGRGAFARVYLARQEDLSRFVALKVARHGGPEAKTLGRLQHENIVPVHSVSTDDSNGLTAVCMGYFGRATLVDMLDAAYAGRGQPDSAEVILRVASERAAPARPPMGEPKVAASASYVEGVARLMLQLAEALACTHAMGILHRDLKPSNVLLAAGGVPMLLDFNLSVDLDTKPMSVGGTLEYMPPELLKSILTKDSRVLASSDPRSDIFSLGAVFYELLTGVVPFGDSERGKTLTDGAKEMLELQEAPSRPPSRINPAIDPTLERIVTKCISIDPANRHASAADLAAELRNYLSPERRLAHEAGQRRRTVLTALSVAMAIVIGLGVCWGIATATRPSDLEHGLQAHQQGDTVGAVASFDRHLKRHPNDFSAIFARGQAWRKKGDFEAAQTDYLRAARLTESGQVRAALAYCLAKDGQHGHAIAWSEMALNANYETAELLNNHAYSQFKLGYLPEARANFDRAIKLDPNLVQPRLNRAILGLREAMREQRSPTPAALADMEFALHKGPMNTELSFTAAWLYALAANFDPAYVKQGEAMLYLAVAQGIEKAQIEPSAIFFEPLRSERIDELLASPRQPVPTTSAELLAAPSFDAEIK